MRRVVAAAVFLLLALTSVGGVAARFGMPEPLTPRGKLVESIYWQITVAGLIVFLIVFVWLVVVLVRFREKTGKGRVTHEAERHSIKAELAWTLIPLAIVMWVGWIGYQGLVQLDESTPIETAEMQVIVTAYQWAWQLDYGDGVNVIVTASPDAKGIVTYSEKFHLPADTPILFNLTSGDVIHAFNIMDANRAFFSMDDANPLGPHKYRNQVLNFPAGDYLVQCKEMCRNPGHAYMRAQIVSEPKAQFDRWLEERTLAAGADLVQKVAITAENGKLSTDQDLTVVKGTRVILEVTNREAQDLVVQVPPQQVGVAPGATKLIGWDLPDVCECVLQASNGGNLTFQVVDATVVTVDLKDYAIEPQTLQLKAGTTYLVQAENVGGTTHNFYLGRWDGTGAKQILAKSVNIGPAGTGSFVFTPTESGSFDTWCDVPGHYGLGMHAQATVA